MPVAHFYLRPAGSQEDPHKLGIYSSCGPMHAYMSEYALAAGDAKRLDEHILIQSCIYNLCSWYDYSNVRTYQYISASLLNQGFFASQDKNSPTPYHSL